LAKKLARVGLIPEPETKAPTALRPFLKAYIDGRADLKPATKIVRGQVIRDLAEFFGESRDLRTITPGNIRRVITRFSPTARNPAHRLGNGVGSGRHGLRKYAGGQAETGRVSRSG